jgi:hypothetical protein
MLRTRMMSSARRIPNVILSTGAILSVCNRACNSALPRASMARGLFLALSEAYAQPALCAKEFGRANGSSSRTGALLLGPRAPFRDKFRPPFRDDDDGLGIRCLVGGTAADFCPVPLSRTLLGGDVGQAPAPHASRVAIPNGQDSLSSPLVASMDRHACSWCENSPAPRLRRLPAARHGSTKSSTTATALMARKDGNRVRLYTRRGYDWSGKYPWIVEALRSLGSAQSSWTGKRFGLERTAGPISTRCIPMPMTPRCSCMASTCSN